MMLNRYLLECNWRFAPALKELPPYLGDWLLDTGSFIKRLQHYSVLAPQVQVIRQAWGMPARSEKLALGLTSRAYALIREVLIHSNEKKWLYARTVFPRYILQGEHRCLARLKERSLGSVLFQDPALQRNPFEIACFSSQAPIVASIFHPIKIAPAELWARRSSFIYYHKPLLVTEFFLPDMKLLCY